MQWAIHHVSLWIKGQERTYVTEFICLVEHPERCSPANITVQRNFQRSRKSTTYLNAVEVFDTLSRGLNLKELEFSREQDRKAKLRLTLIARVQIAAITSREPPNTRLSGRVGSYSQIAVVVSIAAIFVMLLITSTLARLTTCAKQLQEGSKRRNARNKSKCTVVVVQQRPIEGHDVCGQVRWFCRWCRCCLCYLM